MSITGDIGAIIKVDKVKVTHLPVDSERNKEEKKACGQDPPSLVPGFF